MLPDKDSLGNPTDDVDMAVTWRNETNPQEVIDKIYQRNLRHFGQAEGSPFTAPPLSVAFGYTGMTYHGTSLVQEGSLPPMLDHISQHEQDILQQLKPTDSPHVTYNNLITFDGFSKAISKWREATSTSPSGKHLGHYKSLLSIDSFASQYTDADPDPGSSILEVLYQVAASAFMSGVTLKHWENITTCMIEKLPGVPKINKLRVIHLYEADYNLINKLIWQRGIVWEAHKNGTLNPSQAGSRPYHTSIETVMSKDNKYMYSSLTKTPMATMDNDAKSCYDRIVASLALLVSHKYGVPEQYCKTVGDTLRQMQFCIRTAMGDSTDKYSHSEATPIHGVGQGGTASPAFWLLVSSVLFNCYQDRATGMTMTDPTGSMTITQWLEALVDDTSLFTNQLDNNDIEKLVRAMEHDAQHWEQYLSASGGALELTKCFYYILSWSFSLTGDAIPLSTAAILQQSPPIHLSEYGKSVQTPIASKHPSEAHKTLGVWKTMTGDVSEQVKVLTQRSKNMANIVATSGMKPYQAEVALRMIYTPAMGYCLPAVDIPEKALNRIQNKALESFTPALGYNKGFPRDVLLGPTAYGGDGVPHLFTESKLQQLEIMVMHLRTKSTLGQLILINLNWIQLTLGIALPLFEHKQEVTILNNWYTSLHKFLLSINCTVFIKDINTPILERQHDRYIMEDITCRSCSISKNQLNTVNNWRLFFQVQVLSDMATATGDQIHEAYLTYPAHQSINDIRTDRQSKLMWPAQPPPTSQASFKLWIRCIRHCFMQRQSQKLRQPLGHWFVSAASSNSQWQTYTNPAYNRLIINTSDRITVHPDVVTTTIRTATFNPTNFETIETIPSNYFPVDVSHTSSNITVHHNKQKMLLPRSSSTVTVNDIDAAIRSATDWQRHLIQHYRIHDIQLFTDTILSINKHTPMIIVSDGGLKDNIGSFGVAMGTTTQEICSIEGPVSGNNEAFTSFRSEAYGMLAGMTFLHLFLQSHQVAVPALCTIYAYCDNLALVKVIQQIIDGVHFPRMYLKPESDIILQIRSEIIALRSLNISISLDHVKGHQDDCTSYYSLPRPAQLNIDADKYATNYMTHQGPQYIYSHLPANNVVIYVNDVVITRDLKHPIRQASRSPFLRAYMIKKYGWHDSVPDIIWWQIHGSSIQSFSRNDRRRIRKFIFNWLPTCEKLHSYDNDVNAECPSCKHPIESHNHILLCPCIQRNTIKATWFVELETFLSGDQYAPFLVNEILYNYILSACTTKPLPILPTLPPAIQHAYNDQQQIGWQHLLRGRLAFRWGTLVANHLASKKVPEAEMTALIWGRKLVKLIFNYILDLWKSRNRVAHQTNDRNESKLSRQRILDKIATLQATTPSVRYCDRHFIYQPMEILEQYSLCSLTSWHRQAVSIIKRNKQYAPANQDIRTALQHISPSIPFPTPTVDSETDPTTDILATSCHTSQQDIQHRTT